MIKMLGEKMQDDIMALLMKEFCAFVKERIEVSHEQKALTKASEGSKEYIEENLNLISKEFLDDLDRIALYTEEELKYLFEKYYNEFGMNRMECDIQEELWKRFLLFAPKYLEKYSKSVSFGEKRILEKVREMQDELKTATEEMKSGLESATLKKETFMKLAKSQSEILKRLAQNIDVPYIDFNKIYGVQIDDYESKYVIYENTFDFRINKDIGDSEERCYIFRFLIKNIGHTNIEKISIDNFCIMYENEIWDDFQENASYVLPVVEHREKLEKCINILPYGEEFIHVAMTRREDELATEEQIDTFMSYYDFDRLFVTFDMIIKGKEERGYRYMLCLSKQYESYEQNDNSINGVYTIDYSVFTDIV